MLAEVKKCADSRDIIGLRYIFVDCLDVDPTFEKYRSDYEFCKKIDGFFESHKDLNGITSNEDKWDEDYWVQLKVDLINNFSQERFEHMLKVAKIVYADKIKRLLAERENSRNEIEQKIEAVLPDTSQKRPIEEIIIQENKQSVDTPPKMTKAELQEEQIKRKRKALEEENQRFEADQRAERARIEAEKRNNAKQQVREDDSSKKWIGIALIIVVMIIVAIAVAII